MFVILGKYLGNKRKSETRFSYETKQDKKLHGQQVNQLLTTKGLQLHIRMKIVSRLLRKQSSQPQSLNKKKSHPKVFIPNELASSLGDEEEYEISAEPMDNIVTHNVLLHFLFIFI